jgi:hypothetical protein
MTKLQSTVFTGLLIFCLLDRANAQVSDVPRPQQGQTLQLQEKQTKVQPSKDGQMQVVAEVPITLTVLQVDAKRTVIRWKRGVFKITDIDGDLVRKNPEIKQTLLQMATTQAGPIVAAMDNLSFDLILSPTWEYQGLANYDEVLAAMVKSLDAVDELRRKNGSPPIEKSFRDLVLNRKTIEQIVPKEALTYLAGNTYPVKRGATATFNGNMPNPLGGDSVASQVKVTFDQANDADGCSVLHASSTMNMDGLVDSMKQMIAKSPIGKPLSPEDEAALRNTRIESTAEYHIDAATGLPKVARQKASTKAQSAEQSEEFLWTAISPG